MHWTVVDDLLVPARIGGHPALDFCNTWAGWGEEPAPGREWLRTYDHLTVWAYHAELVGRDHMKRLRRLASGRADEATATLASARRLRAALHSAVLDPTDARAMATVTGQVRKAADVVRIQPGPRPEWDLPGLPRLDLPLLAVAWAAGQLLTAEPLDRVRACPGDDCGWLFLDRSGRRRWCSMSACGNRAKVRAHAQRVRASR